VTPCGRHVGVTEHPRDLLHARFSLGNGHVARRHAAFLALRHHEMLVGVDRDLGQVRDHERLAAFSRHVHQRLAHPAAHFPADPLIDLVEHQCRHDVMRREHHLQREHETGELAAGRRLA